MNEKRKRDEGSSKTEDIIQAALREQQEAKKAKKQVGPDVNEAADKGKTLGDIEQEEGGTIKESEVAMAHAKRTQKRKARKGTREGTFLEGFRLSSIPLLPYASPEALPADFYAELNGHCMHLGSMSRQRHLLQGCVFLQTPSW